MGTYPAQLVFALTDVKTTAALLEAALSLQLPFETDGSRKTMTVVVDSPMTAYQFGVRTHELRQRPIKKSVRSRRSRGTPIPVRTAWADR
jgi:hypothetical protein